MDQLYQSGNIVSVKPRKGRDVERAKAVEGVLNFQLESLNNIDTQGGSYLTMMKWFFNALVYGKGIAKAYWRKEERITPRRMAIPVPKLDMFGNLVGMDIMDHVSQEMQTLYDGPYVEILHNKLFIPHPEYKDIQQMPQCFIVYSRPIDYAKRLAQDGTYKNLKELGIASLGGSGIESRDSREAFVKSLSIEGADTPGDSDSERKSPEIDIIEAYAKMIIDDAPYEVGSGLKIKGMEEEVIVHIGNYRTILSLQRNQYGMRPLFDMGAYYHPELYWDLGLVTLTKGIQRQADNLANLRIQNVMMQVNQMLKVNVNSDIDPQSLVWRPFGLIPVDDMQDVEPIQIPDFNSNLFMEQEMFYKDAIHDIMGFYPWNMGMAPERQEKVGVVHAVQSMGEARAKLLLMSMDYLGIRPLLKYMMILNTFHLPSGFEFRVGAMQQGAQQQFGRIFGEDIHPDFDFSARYTSMEPALGKMARSQQLVQMAQMWSQSPWINQFQYTKLMMELLDIREAEYLLKTPQQLAQEMQQQAQQAAQQAMMAEQMKRRYEAEGKLQVSKADFKEDYILADQQFTHDMALEAIKQEKQPAPAAK
jgi:hypothetical protein